MKQFVYIVLETGGTNADGAFQIRGNRVKYSID
jgi:hypothetical protein